jgi:hypothetical protein
MTVYKFTTELLLGLLVLSVGSGYIFVRNFKKSATYIHASLDAYETKPVIRTLNECATQSIQWMNQCTIFPEICQNSVNRIFLACMMPLPESVYKRAGGTMNYGVYWQHNMAQRHAECSKINFQDPLFKTTWCESNNYAKSKEVKTACGRIMDAFQSLCQSPSLESVSLHQTPFS